MKMRLAYPVACAALALAACATPPAPAKANYLVSDGRDCAVMTAILKDHYKIEPGSRLRLQRGDPDAPDQTGYHINCDFKAAGVPIEDYDYAHKNAPGDFQGWVTFAGPTYPTPTTAQIETGYLIGPLAGAGAKCTLRSGVAGWSVEKCEMTWIS